MYDLLELAIRDAVIAIFEEEIPLNDPFEAGDLVMKWIYDFIKNWDNEEQEDELRVETRIIKKVYEKDGFCIFGCVPTKNYPELKLNPTYQNFTITGNLPFLNEGEVYTLDLEEAATTKYGTQYKVLSVPKQDSIEITDDNEFALLLQVTSRQIAYDINKVYPNFIRLILDGKEDEIDLKKIYNVKSARFESIKKQINENHKYFKILTSK